MFPLSPFLTNFSSFFFSSFSLSFFSSSLFLVEELLVSSLLLGSASVSLGLDGVELVGDGRVLGDEPVRLLEVLEGRLLVLEADVGEPPAVERLGLLLAREPGDGEGRGGEADGVVPGLELSGQQGGVGVEGEAQGREGGLGLGRLFLEVGLLVEVAQALLVLLEAELEVAGLEGLGAVVLGGRGDLEDLLGAERLLVAVLREVLVGVAEGVGLLDVGGQGGLAGELAAVEDGGLLLGLVAGAGLEVLNLADDGLAIQDLAEDDVLVVQMGGWYSSDEELRAVGIWDEVST